MKSPGRRGGTPRPAVGRVVVEDIERLAHRDGEAALDRLVPLGGLPANGRVEGEVDAEHGELVVAPAPAGAGEVGCELLLADELEEGVPRVEIRDEDPGHVDARAVCELDGPCEAVSHLDADDGRAHANLAPVVLEEADQCLGENVGAADADRPAVRLERAGEHDGVVGAEPEDVAGPGELGDHEAEPRLHFGRLEEVAGHVVRAREEVTQEPEPLTRLLQRRELLRGRYGRREHRRYDRLLEHIAVQRARALETSPRLTARSGRCSRPCARRSG